MIREVISFDNAYVNYRHLAILADVMTFRGCVLTSRRSPYPLLLLRSPTPTLTSLSPPGTSWQ